MWDKLTHKWLGVPYTLYITTDQRVKKPRATVLFVHGIGNSGAAWDDVVTGLPHDLRLVSIDLLGFGQSKRPAWAVYDVKTQARSVLATYIKLRIRGRVIVVGHSLGALVAVEIAKRYPRLVRSLILCSPPFYRPDPVKQRLLPNGDKMLKDIYRHAKKRPSDLIALSRVAMKLGLVNKSFSLSRDNAASYVSALESSIINQTSLDDAANLNIPIHILYGRLDPVVLLKNLRLLAERNTNVTLTTLFTGHEVQGMFVAATVKAISDMVGKTDK